MIQTNEDTERLRTLFHKVYPQAKPAYFSSGEYEFPYNMVWQAFQREPVERAEQDAKDQYVDETAARGDPWPPWVWKCAALSSIASLILFGAWLMGAH